MQQALDLLERLLQAAEDGGRTGSLIEILILQALGRRARGDVRAALVPLERALALAEPEGYVRVFVDEGAPMAALLEAAARQAIAPAYVRRLLSAFGHAEARTPAKQPLVEPLSERELDVLRLLASDLDGPDIARELVVSLNTVRSHTKNIYAKLGVNSRREAVRRAEDLDLLSRARHGRHAPDSASRRVARCRRRPRSRGSLLASRSRKSPHQSPHAVMPSHHVHAHLVDQASAGRETGGDDPDNDRRKERMSGRAPTHGNGHEPGRYEIRLKGHLDGRWAAWFDGLNLSREADGTTIIHGPIADQAALHGLLQKVRDTGLPLVSVTCVEPDP